MAKTIQHGKPRPNRGNSLKNTRRIKANEAILSKLSKANSAQ